jgi:hypothetical protein
VTRPLPRLDKGIRLGRLAALPCSRRILACHSAHGGAGTAGVHPSRAAASGRVRSLRLRNEPGDSPGQRKHIDRRGERPTSPRREGNVPAPEEICEVTAHAFGNFLYAVVRSGIWQYAIRSSRRLVPLASSVCRRNDGRWTRYVCDLGWKNDWTLVCSRRCSRVLRCTLRLPP